MKLRILLIFIVGLGAGGCSETSSRTVSQSPEPVSPFQERGKEAVASTGSLQPKTIVSLGPDVHNFGITCQWAQSATAQLNEAAGTRNDYAIGERIKTFGGAMAAAEKQTFQWDLPVDHVVIGRFVVLGSQFDGQGNTPPPFDFEQPSLGEFDTVLVLRREDPPIGQVALKINRDISSEEAASLHAGDKLRVTGLIEKIKFDPGSINNQIVGKKHFVVHVMLSNVRSARHTK